MGLGVAGKDLEGEEVVLVCVLKGSMVFLNVMSGSASPSADKKVKDAVAKPNALARRFAMTSTLYRVRMERSVGFEGAVIRVESVVPVLGRPGGPSYFVATA